MMANSWLTLVDSDSRIVPRGNEECAPGPPRSGAANQEPGVGPAQPHRAAVGVGPDENQPVRPISAVHDPYTYPMTAKAIRVTITPVMNAGKDGR